MKDERSAAESKSEPPRRAPVKSIIQSRPPLAADVEALARKTIVVRYDDVVIDEEFNSRKDYREVPQLAEDIRARGMLQPPIVTLLPDGRPALRAGFRRMRAVRLLREEARKNKAPVPFEEIEVRVFDGNELEQYIVNLMENLLRKDLHVWEIGDRCVLMRDRFQLSGAAIGDLMRYKKSHVNNCMRVVEKIATDIQKTFREGRAEPPFMLLVQLATLQKPDGTPDHDRQRDAWQKWLTGGVKKKEGGDGAETESEAEAGDEGDSGGRMRRLREAERMLHLLEVNLKAATNEKSREYFRGAIATAKFMMGIAEKVRYVKQRKK